ncbi:MAG TPA: phosphoenolpyruvate carboxylase [Cyclobacteriaceae bacterium]|nr:phosphoenolpyruvate carboxylase [Cyclobacteriaceae bacterium]
MATNFDQIIASRYHIYNSLLLNLPFQDIVRTGTLLPLLQQYCENGFDKGQSPQQIIKEFFSELIPGASHDEQFDRLFSFIQYVERQVALFDSIEDSAFEQINDTRGKGTIAALLLRTNFEDKAAQLKAKLETFSLRVVLTAHPTQFYPGSVLGILTDLEQAIRESDLQQINLLLQQLGKTGFINRQKPTPYDEAVSLCWYLENVFYTAIPEIIAQLSQGLNEELNAWQNDKLIVIGFWPGGDRDGNPFVIVDTTLRVAERLRMTITRCYYRDLRTVRRRLTFQGVDKIILEIERKLGLQVAGKEISYQDADQLLAELNQAREILISKHNGLFLNILDMLMLKIKLFGFHFGCMDIRQDSRKHDQVWTYILDKLHPQGKSISSQELSKLPIQEQINYLLKFDVDISKEIFEDPFVLETVNSIKAIAQIQKANGPAACHRYVISNCQQALHVIEVYKLAKMLIGTSEGLELDIVPLFETIDDLANAPEIMNSLLSIKEYRDHLDKRSNRQTIMLGFSDGTKDGGYLRANWSIFRAKENLTSVLRKHGLKAIFFDGRGGPPARGGGNTHDFYASLGDTIEQEEVQITIQGQTISSNFGKVASCKFNLEQWLSAGLEGTVFDNRQNKLGEEDKVVLEELAQAGYTSYLGLKHHDKFVPYLEKVTPLAFFGDTNIGSRPVKRNNDALKFEDLRAIPFVGAWGQMKQNIPGFYGVGSAIEKLDKSGKGDQLKKLYKDSLFFRTLLSNSMMSLTKTYYPATKYLSSDPEFGEFWNKMFSEYQLSVKKTLEVSGLAGLMENNPAIRDSVRLRERIVLPLITIQQYALMNLRNLDEGNKANEARYRKLIIRCMFGIINAARNSA